MSQEIEFNADISQLMKLIVNAFYSKNEIFLRELLSNSSDALEKIRFQSLTDKSVLDTNTELKIRISIDKDNKNIIIEDSGIGMTREDLINNIGTIAKSGTKQFIENIKSKTDIEQIGQFGVGFYSCFLVAKSVKLYTKHNSDKEYIWESDSEKSYTITENSETTISRGTRLILSINDENHEYLNTNKLKTVIEQYMQFINYPIEILETKTIEIEEKVECQENADTQENKDIDEPEIEDLHEDKSNLDEKITTTIQKEVDEWVQINKVKPIWTRHTNEVTQDEYINFYKSIMRKTEEPISYKHFTIEGQDDIKSILYIPEYQPNLFGGNEQKTHGVKLYVKKIFIKDNCDGLVPEWLNFMVGLIDSQNLKLNVSRELLQETKSIYNMKKIITKKSIEMFQELAENDVDKYTKFYYNYSKMLKLGIHEDERNREKLINLLRFKTLFNQDKQISFQDYLTNMSQTQEKIYYIIGPNFEAIKNSPFLEGFNSKKLDVLFFDDAIDEYMIQQIKEYQGKALVNITRDGIKFDEENIKKMTEESVDLIDFFKTSLPNLVENVKISDRLSSTPCMLSTSEYGWTANMERIMKAQALRNNDMDKYMTAKKILEINLNHSLIKMIKMKLNIPDETNKLKSLIRVLYDTALLNSGFVIEKPSELATRINKMLSVNFCDEDDILDIEKLEIKEELQHHVIDNEITEKIEIHEELNETTSDINDIEKKYNDELEEVD